MGAYESRWVNRGVGRLLLPRLVGQRERDLCPECATGVWTWIGIWDAHVPNSNYERPDYCRYRPFFCPESALNLPLKGAHFTTLTATRSLQLLPLISIRSPFTFTTFTVYPFLSLFNYCAYPSALFAIQHSGSLAALLPRAISFFFSLPFCIGKSPLRRICTDLFAALNLPNGSRRLGRRPFAIDLLSSFPNEPSNGTIGHHLSKHA